MRLNNLGNDTLPQINSLVRIKTELISNRTSRNTRQSGHDLQGISSDFQLGIISNERGINNYDVIIFRNRLGYQVYTINIEFLEVLCLDITVENNFEQFIKSNSSFLFDNTMLSDSEDIYPMAQRLSHERLNDMEIEEIQKTYSYEQLTTHLIKALMAIASLEERFNIIKDASRSRKSDEKINSNVVERMARPNKNTGKKERGLLIDGSKLYMPRSNSELITIDNFYTTFDELETSDSEPSEPVIESILPNKPSRR